jgi:S-(hydroxymethyl)glutathione dehydrogenase/alcohol dehydrogenase
MKVKAAVCYAPHTPLMIEELDLDEPKEGEVLVRIASAGVCHSDYHVMKGEWNPPLPMVLGHEGAGVVEKVGSGVTMSRPGDHVILNFRPNCGFCKFCQTGRPVLCNGSASARWFMFDGSVRLHKGSTDINHFARVACFAEYAVVPQSGAVPVRKDMPLDKACLIGCSVMTGVGAVINTAGIEPGSSVLVIGCGGVGLNCIQGARLAGAGRIIAVDMLENKLAFAREFGATDVIDASKGDVVERIQNMTDGGVDYAFEAIGREQTVREAWDAARAGGTTVVLGLMPKGDLLTIDPWHFIYEKTLKGCFLGSARIGTDIPRIVDRYHAGELDLDELVSHRITLAELPEAFDRLRAGDATRQLVVF